MKKKYSWKAGVLGLLLLTGTACTDEMETGVSGILRQGEVALQWLGPNMGIQHVGTRGTDSKTAEEQQINNVHVFVFNADGKYLAVNTAGGVSDAFQGYRYVPNGQNLVLQSSMFDQVAAAENATIVAVANLPEDAFGTVGSSGHPDGIANKAALAEHVYNLQTFTASLPETGLPMIGVAQANLAYNDATSGRIVTVQMQSLMARIDLDFTMNPYQSSDNRQNPSLRIDEVYVGNFPKGCTIDPQLDPEILTGNAMTEVTQGVTLQEETTVDATGFTGQILREGSPQSLTLYMFEHARAAKALEDVFKDQTVGKDGYPENIANDEKQRYKNDLAADEAAYIKLEGVYTNHNGYKYAVTYTLYPGANAEDDFTIKHNRQYKHNITVTGITVNSLGEEALLDTRVDIDTEANPYFIEMLREREHDAHFCVTPMDVFIYKNGGSVKVEIIDADNTLWIRMEPMRYAPEDCNPKGKWAADEAGEGKRKYFLTNLVQSDGSNKAVLQGKGYYTNYTVEYNNEENTDPDKLNDKGVYEERIYFYIDENVPTQEQANNHQAVPERTAKLKITYTAPTPADGSTPYTHSREALIRQAGMLPVQYHRSDNVNVNDPYWFYIEYYEEYLEHYDGKDSFTHTYDGLPWGLKGLVTNLGTADGEAYMPYGWRNTMIMMQQFRNNTNEGKAQKDITLNDKPRSAAEYCYNKNKRNTNGEVETCHWYLPSIREIENAMDRYYGTFNVFQNEWYWSSNPGAGEHNRPNGYDLNKGNITWTGESEDYARATKSQLNDDGETFSHAPSEANNPYARGTNGEWDTWYDPDDWEDLPNASDVPNPPAIGVTEEGQGGFANREKVFRIRAAYIYSNDNATLDNSSYLRNN